MLNLKNKLTFFILTIVLVIFGLFITFNHFYVERKNKINQIEQKLFVLENNLLHSFNEINILLFKSLNDTSLNLTDQNLLLLNLQKNIPKMNKEFEGLHKDLKIFPIHPESQLSDIIKHYHSYIAYLSEITDLLEQKAAPNTGICYKINQIENNFLNPDIFNQQMVNELLFASQSYMLFKDQELLDDIHWLSRNIENDIKKQRLKQDELARYTSMISYYNVLFDNLKDIDIKLDFHLPNSYTSQLINEKDYITDLFSETYKNIKIYEESVSKYSIIYYGFLFIIVLLIALSLNLFVNKHILKPLNWLSNNVVKILYDKHNKEEIPEKFYSFIELTELYNKILVLLQYLKDQEEKRQMAQKQLKQSELRYRELADMLPQSVYETDIHGKLIYGNRAWNKTFGYDLKDIDRGVNIIEAIISETGEGVMGNRRFVHSDFIGIRKDGTTFPAIVYSNQVIKNGKMSGIRGIVIDNTERKKYIELLKKEKERAEQKDNQKTSILTGMSHEIRTPMNAILGFADLLTSLELSNKQKEEFINHINQSSKHILHLIDDIVDLASIEKGGLNINYNPVQLDFLFKDLYSMYNEILHKSHKSSYIKLILNQHGQTNITVDTDQYRLKQVMNNLLANAVKYTDKGIIEYGFEIIDNTQIRFYVKDSGKGISDDQLKHIFEKINPSEMDQKAEKGIGLAVSKRIIEHMGGRIWAESDTGVETCFNFILPFHKSKIKITNKKTFSDSYNWKDKLILVAEDEDLNYKVIKEFLGKTQAKAIRAYDGEEAVELCRTNKKIDLVLMDIKMPRKDGYLATMEIKKFKETLPVIAVTAYAMSDEKDKCLQAGCDGYLSKPFKKSDFLNTIDPFLKENVQLSKE